MWIPYWFRWLWGKDLEEAEQERIAFISEKFSRDRLTANIELLSIDRGSENLLKEVKTDMISLGLDSCVLDLDYDLVINDNTLSIIKRNKVL